MVFPGAFGKLESPNLPPEMAALDSLMNVSGLTVHQVLERIFYFFYGDAKVRGIQTIFNNDVYKLKLGGQGTNSEELGLIRMKEIHEAQVAASRWFASGKQGSLNAHGKIDSWLIGFLKNEASQHVAAYQRGER